MTGALLSVRELSVRFGRGPAAERVVDEVTFDVRPGETFAIVGESGAGKSLTASAILGLLPDDAVVTSGSITLNGEEVLTSTRSSVTRFRGSQIGMIFQNPLASLDPSFRIGNQLKEIIGLHRPAAGKRERHEIAETWLRNVGIDDAARVLSAYPHELSGGMRQRVMIALASLSGPALLIADEPTTALDAVVQKQILDLLTSVTGGTGGSLLLITHDFGVVSYAADRVAVMKDGRIVEQDRRDRVLTAPADAYTRSLIRAVPEIGARFRLAERNLPRRLGPAGGDRPAGAVAEPRDDDRDARPTGPPLVTLRNVSKEFVVGGLGTGQHKRRFRAVGDVSLHIGRGEVFGLIGESGSGKSTLSRLIGGLLQADAGEIVFDGRDIARLSKAELRRLRPRFQFVFQDATSSLNPRVPVGEQISRPLLRLGKAASRAAGRARATEALDLVGLPSSSLHRYPHELSGGQRQRIGIARALALEPDLLILDEPTSALDVSTQANILNLLLDLREELDLTYLFIGHNLAIVELLCDRVGVLEQGVLLETFRAEELSAADRHPVTRALLDAVLPINDENRREIRGIRGHAVAGKADQ
ncbi:ABC transporter ATP-binding protein [Microbispora sp. NBRC 16548]|uniref:dipeptide ABC transporter ATP-binding protein n=1 Tax=Microbispora sp. NBRC 16548 TaxID=3030994 RepID=UPI0024A2759E|nr:ABC transporter ATP-binding protein [Microbispora sp. NBRC 16548]GLX10198.1 ABC transporter permease [Microbispora sp. NBRC 16548]